jgi:signal transduction histidine kinase
MKSFSRRFRPDHLAGQLTILVLIAIVLFHVTLTIVFRTLNAEPKLPFVGPVELMASSLLAIDLAQVSERQNVLSDLAHVTPWASFTIQDERPAAARPSEQAPKLNILRAHLWPQADIYMASTPSKGTSQPVVIALRKGAYALVSASQTLQTGLPPPPNGYQPGEAPFDGLPKGPPPGSFIFIGSALFFFLCAAILTIWTSNTVVSPLVKLAGRAERLPSESNEQDLIIEEGPQEVRELTRALNRMQIRIYSMITARAQVLAAVSHDLRTIITRMRLRAEFIDDEMLRTKMLEDIELMDSMLYKNLQHLRQARKTPEQSLIDLDSVLQTVSDQFVDLGRDVTYRGGKHQMIRGSLTDLQRVFNNLIENAITYAGKVVVAVEEPSADVVQIDVMDEGPGISAQDKARVIEPFVRGQPARNMNEHGGFGLGLSIVRTLVEEVGGTLQLLDREPHGLIVRVILPRAFVESRGSNPSKITYFD